MQMLLLITIPACMAAAVLLVGHSLRLTRRGTVGAIGAVSRYGYRRPRPPRWRPRGASSRCVWSARWR